MIHASLSKSQQNGFKYGKKCPARAAYSTHLSVAERRLFKKIQILLKTVELFREDPFMVVSLILLQMPQFNNARLLCNDNGNSSEQRLCKAESHYRSK